MVGGQVSSDTPLTPDFMHVTHTQTSLLISSVTSWKNSNAKIWIISPPPYTLVLYRERGNGEWNRYGQYFIIERMGSSCLLLKEMPAGKHRIPCLVLTSSKRGDISLVARGISLK